MRGLGKVAHPEQDEGPSHQVVVRELHGGNRRALVARQQCDFFELTVSQKGSAPNSKSKYCLLIRTERRTTASHAHRYQARLFYCMKGQGQFEIPKFEFSFFSLSSG